MDVRESDARETLRANLPGEIDLLFLDGANEMYREVLAVHRPARGTPERWSWRTTPAGRPDFREPVRSSGRYLSADVGGDVEVALLV